MRAMVYDGPEMVALREVPAPCRASRRRAGARDDWRDLRHRFARHRWRFAGVEQGAVLGHEFVGESSRSARRSHAQARRSRHVLGLHRLWALPLVRRAASTGIARSAPSSGRASASARPCRRTGRIVRVPHADTTLAIPHGCSAEAALLIGDNLATGWAAVERARLAPGDSVVVIGGGAVGHSPASLRRPPARAGRGRRAQASAARFARAMARSPPLRRGARLSALTHGDGADVAIEAVGSPAR